jgi:oligoribonuclease NrnB/cAMP/cGMP phosphodiesterase (DHH superfamily)
MYHYPCPDGIAAAVAAHTFLKTKQGLKENKDGSLDGATFYPVTYGDRVPAVDSDTHVYVLDFTFTAGQTAALAREAATVTVIDHHISAFADMQALHDSGTIDYVFDNKRSGAGLAWDTLVGSRPDIVDYLEDFDLWTKIWPISPAINIAACSRPYTLKDWRPMFDRSISIVDLIEEGQILLRGRARELELLAANARIVKDFLGSGHTVLVANCPHHLATDLGDILNKSMPFAVTFDMQLSTRNIRVSFRSCPDSPESVEVDQLAKSLGGGGHKRAAGATFPINSKQGRALLDVMSEWYDV